MATAEGGVGREPPGLGPRTRRSTATGNMAEASASADAAGGAEEGKPREVSLRYVLGLPVEVPLPVAVSRMDAAVPRKARTGRFLPRPKPAAWWDFHLPVPRVKPAKRSPGKRRRAPVPRRQRVCLGLGAPSPSDVEAAAAAAGEKPAKKARICVQCGSSQTPQWRSGPMGRSTLCNACGVRLRAAGALRDAVERRAPRRPPPPPPAPAPAPAVTKVASPPPPPPPAAATPPPQPESPSSDSDSPICERSVPVGDVYLVRKQQPKREKRAPKKEASPPSSPASSPAIYLVKKKKPAKKPWRPRNTGQRCLHCGTTSTPQWREGPMGRHTLCNACGVRYRQGRLLPEYRPAASPTFVPSEHSSRHRDVLQLHKQHKDTPAQLQNKPADAKPLPLDGTDNNLLLLPAPRAGDSADASTVIDEDDKLNVFLVRRHPEKEPYPPTPPHRPLPQPVVEDDPRVVTSNCNTTNNTNPAPPGAPAACNGGGDAPSALDSLLLDGPSAPLIVDGGDDFLVR